MKKPSNGFLLITVFCVALILQMFFSQKAAPVQEVNAGYVAKSADTSRSAFDSTKIVTYEPELHRIFSITPLNMFQPDVQASSAVIIDINSDQILFEKNSDQRLKIASLTKVMTAIIALEHGRLDQPMYVSDRAATVGENSMGLSVGETYTLEELLYGLIMHSGNDAAYAIAEGLAGSVEDFTEWMNYQAEFLGLTDTKFFDPSGLNDSTYSTPRDLVKLTRYALKHPKFREIVKTVDYELIGNQHKYIYLQNQTNLLTSYPGVAGVKTGYTEEAGLCLITYASNGGRELVGVVLNSTDRKGDMILMLDHGFNSLGLKIEHNLLDPL